MRNIGFALRPNPYQDNLSVTDYRCGEIWFKNIAPNALLHFPTGAILRALPLNSCFFHDSQNKSELGSSSRFFSFAPEKKTYSGKYCKLLAILNSVGSKLKVMVLQYKQIVQITSKWPLSSDMGSTDYSKTVCSSKPDRVFFLKNFLQLDLPIHTIM